MFLGPGKDYGRVARAKGQRLNVSGACQASLRRRAEPWAGDWNSGDSSQCFFAGCVSVGAQAEDWSWGGDLSWMILFSCPACLLGKAGRGLSWRLDDPGALDNSLERQVGPWTRG